MINEKVKQKIKEWVDKNHEISRDVVEPFAIATINDKKIKVYTQKAFLRGVEWSYGDEEEPMWGPNEEAIFLEITQLEELQGREFTDEEIEEIKEFAWEYAESKVYTDYEYPGGDLGRKIIFATFKDECSKEEFQKALARCML